MTQPSLPSSEPQPDRMDGLLPRCWAAMLLLLLAVTYRLWIPASSVPAVPLFKLPENLPVILWALPLACLFIALIPLAAWTRMPRSGWWVVAGSLAVSFVLDQHRIQPWAYQSMIYALLFASMPAAAARRWMIPLAISIYVYSGAGKLDYQFAHSVGRDMVEAIARPLGGIPESIDESWRARLALILPGTECLLGLCLVAPPLRRLAGVMIIAMHVTLITLLGPWGLGHSPGVLVWNGLLIVQAWFLFVYRRAEPPDAQSPDAQSPAVPSPEEAARRFSMFAAVRDGGFPAGLAAAVVFIALVAPLFERSGYWDHWPSWALYAPHNSRVDVEIHRSVAESLDVTASEFLKEDTDGDGWQKLSLGEWSLESLGVPVYPQARYQLGLVLELARRDQLGKAVRVRIRGTSDRWTGARSEQFAIGQREIKKAGEQFWLGP